ncbi:MAG: FecR domain-containing protein, partial [Draconibacterium sp.]|nr:FecR domain-containing protein [Draconibacterium sp.]
MQIIMIDNQQIKRIITKKITGKLNSDEQKILNNWISTSEENKKEFDAYLKLWKMSEELILSKTIDVESSLLMTKKKISSLKSNKRWISYLRQAAAILILSFSLNFVFNYFIQTKTPNTIAEQIVYQEVKAAFGTQTKLILADGSTVWLNSGSTLRFPASFLNMDERKVELNGEGYFEVTKNEEKPFIVNTSELDVKVYGTSFNVTAYEGYNSVTVALVKGKVSLLKNYVGGQKELIVLKPNEAVEYNSDEKKLYLSTNLHMEKYTGWKNGYIVFYGDPIDKVIQRLEKWYNVDIVAKDKSLHSFRFTATFIDESLEQV